MDPSHWNARYETTDRLWPNEPNLFVRDRLKTVPPGVGVDLGAGEGRNALWLSSIGWDMTAVDFSSIAVERGQHESDAVKFEVADALEWEPVGAVDLILVAYLHLPFEAVESLLRKLPTWLSPGGEVFLIGHDISNLEHGYGGPQVPEILWNVSDLLSWLGPVEVIEAIVVRRPVETEDGTVNARDTLVRVRATPRTERA